MRLIIYYYRLYKKQPLISVLKRINDSFHFFTNYFNIIFVSTPTCYNLSFPSMISNQNSLIVFFVNHTRSLSHSTPYPWLGQSNHILSGELVLKLYIIYYSLTFCQFIAQNPAFGKFQVTIFPPRTDQVSYPYSITRKIGVWNILIFVLYTSHLEEQTAGSQYRENSANIA
jgi:hypothetical protein